MKMPWQAQEDARVLMQAEEIKQDKARAKAAATHLAAMHANSRAALMNVPSSVTKPSEDPTPMAKPGAPVMPKRG